MTNAFAVLRPLPMTDREKDAEILVLRHRLAVLERRLGGKRARFTAADQALLAAPLCRFAPWFAGDAGIAGVLGPSATGLPAGRARDPEEHRGDQLDPPFM
jgi:hypothetical protein